MNSYIPVDIEMTNDDRMCALINRHGMKGYGLYIALLTELRRRENYTCDTESLKHLVRKYRTSAKVMWSIVLDFDLFDIEQFGDLLLISSPYLDKAMKNHDKKVEKCRAAGTKGARKRWEQENGVSHSDPIAIYNVVDDNTNTVKENSKKKTEKQQIEESTEYVTATGGYVKKVQPKDKESRWREYLDCATTDRPWVELQAKHSGMGTTFLIYFPLIVEVFIEHLLIYGKESELHSEAAVKRYFANYIRKGTVTQKRIAECVVEWQKILGQHNQYPYETVDPITGERTFQGQVIPADAPPRPNEHVSWNDALEAWC